MIFPGKGLPVLGSFTGTDFLKNGFAGLSSSLKSPVRIARLGTVPVAVWPSRRLIHSSAQKKNSFVFSRWVTLGMKTGPPISQPYWLKRKGAGPRYCDTRGL